MRTMAHEGNPARGEKRLGASEKRQIKGLFFFRPPSLKMVKVCEVETDFWGAVSASAFGGNTGRKGTNGGHRRKTISIKGKRCGSVVQTKRALKRTAGKGHQLQRGETRRIRG